MFFCFSYIIIIKFYFSLFIYVSVGGAFREQGLRALRLSSLADSALSLACRGNTRALRVCNLKLFIYLFIFILQI